jgi:hypothetical protein
MIKKAVLSLIVVNSFAGFCQTNESNSATITGNIESTFQYLRADSLIEASLPPEKGLLNSYMNAFYTQGNFRAGIRLESYLPHINGYPDRFEGTGIGMRYIGFSNKMLDVTLGTFYEQFSTGLLFRAYENRALGYDNALDGMRLIVRPVPGVVLKGIYGGQRQDFKGGVIIHSAGLVRGLDGELHVNELVKLMKDKKFDLTIGASFVSKFQKDDNNDLILPQNVGSYGGRTKMRYGKITFDAEYVVKENDPSTDNLYIYNRGHAALFNLGYSKKGFGFSFSGKSADNMSYRSDRTQGLQVDLINYLPSMNKTHTYNLVASLYPYATQLNGEIAYQTEVLYTIPKGSKLGGKYGTTLNGNYSSAYKPNQSTMGINKLDSTGIAYTNKPFDRSADLFWQDINFSLSRKFSKSFNLVVSYFDIKLNNDVAKVTEDATGIIHAHIGVVEFGYKINKNHSFRCELQELVTNQGAGRDKGDWATAVVEYNYKSHWSFGFMDQYNYAHPEEHLRIHYIVGTVGYVQGSTRFMVTVGRQRAGLFCVGGVCRNVPASNGLTFTFTQSF